MIPFNYIFVLAFSVRMVGMAALVVGLTGLLVGVLLGIAAKIFAVAVNEKETKVRELLPGNNCGGCGFAGCDGLAKAIAEGKAPVNGCPVSNAETHKKIGEVMGKSVEEKEKQVAFVKCAGTCDKTVRKFNYEGIEDCRTATFVPGKTDKACSYGCMGFGSCVKVCKFDAIHVINGVAIVDKEKCVACGKCVVQCPQHIIELVPYTAKEKVKCSSKDKGPAVMKACSAGCIGCMLCTKVCESGAITVTDNLAHIDYSKCTKCGKCVQKCPRKIIVAE
jgi:electron transport complex protein RnfB